MGRLRLLRAVRMPFYSFLIAYIYLTAAQCKRIEDRQVAWDHYC